MPRRLRRESFDVERSPRYRLAALSRRWLNATERAYDERHGISLSEWRILAFVGSEQPINATAIADRGMLEKPHISRLVARLVDRGLIRTEPDTVDTRRNWLFLTDAGGEVYRDLVDLSLTRDEEFLSILNEREVRQLNFLLDKLLSAAP